MNNLEFDKKLLFARLSKEDFSILTKTPMATIKNWTVTRKGKNCECPNWVEVYLDLYIKNSENEIYIEQLIKELKNEK